MSSKVANTSAGIKDKGKKRLQMSHTLTKINAVQETSSYSALCFAYDGLQCMLRAIPVNPALDLLRWPIAPAVVHLKMKQSEKKLDRLHFKSRK